MTISNDTQSRKMGVLSTLINESKMVFDKIHDHRKKSNATKYSISDCCMGGLSVFILQDESFLSNQKRLKERCGKDNFANLFCGMKIPTANNIKKVLDQITPDNFNALLDYGLDFLQRTDKLNEFRFLNDGYLVALDGVEYHSSPKVTCDCCNTRVHKTKTTYHHSMICGAIVHPDKKEVIALRPEFITNSTEQTKQDCENAAAKRWIAKNSDFYKDLKITILGDDLYSKESICSAILANQMNFILVCKPQTHKIMYEYIAIADLNTKTVQRKIKNKKMTYKYSYVNNIPIKDGEDVLHVNWLEIIVTKSASNVVTYRNSFATSHTINDDNVEEIASAGRGRWKIENENNNILKTKGYNFEHNYGHGKKNLAADLAILTLAAFLFHTIAILLCSLYNLAMKAKGSRQRFYYTLRALTAYMIFASWESLLLFVANPPDNLEYKPGTIPECIQ